VKLDTEPKYLILWAQSKLHLVTANKTDSSFLCKWS